jgi:N,N'-diacetyllegionaminate synthase
LDNKLKNKVFFKIKNKKYSSYKKVFIIAEIGTNHNNSYQTCKKLILLAKKSGCDAVKFQIFKADELLQKKSPGYSILKKHETPIEWIPKISKLCKKINIFFICSPFFLDAIDILKKNKCDALKIASPEIKNIPLVEKCLNTKLPIIISTGYCEKKDIDRVYSLIKKNKKNSFGLLHCVSEYPAKINSSNLNMINFLKQNYKNIAIGFSDHSIGVDISIYGVSMGAAIIEKHITLSKTQNGPDHFFALNPDELIDLVKKIRKFEIAYGNYTKTIIRGENKVFISAITKKKLLKNSRIKLNNLTFKRTKNLGINYWDLKKILNKKVNKNLKEDYKVMLKDFI